MSGTESHPNDASELGFHENLLKGQTAQNLVERLFAAHDYPILPYGVESRFPGWAYKREVERTEAYNQVRAAPDFLVEVPTDYGRRRLYHLEVKFRASGKIGRAEMKKYLLFPDTIIVLVGIGSIEAGFLNAFVDGGRLIPIRGFDLLKLDDAIVSEFERLAEGLFQWTKKESNTAAPIPPHPAQAATQIGPKPLRSKIQ